jgi:hypothetical protein
MEMEAGGWGVEDGSGQSIAKEGETLGRRLLEMTLDVDRTRLWCGALKSDGLGRRRRCTETRDRSGQEDEWSRTVSGR